MQLIDHDTAAEPEVAVKGAEVAVDIVHKAVIDREGETPSSADSTQDL